MDKLIRVALATKFKEEDVDNILFIANATGNASIACEMLLGVFEQPEVPECAFGSESRKNREITSYNVFKDEVRFTYNQVNSKQAFFRKDEENPSEDNMVSDEYYASDAWKKLDQYSSEEHFSEWCERITYAKTVSDRKSNSSCSLEQWNEWHEKGAKAELKLYALAD